MSVWMLLPVCPPLSSGVFLLFHRSHQIHSDSDMLTPELALLSPREERNTKSWEVRKMEELGQQFCTVPHLSSASGEAGAGHAAGAAIDPDLILNPSPRLHCSTDALSYIFI